MTEPVPWTSLHVFLDGGAAVEDRCLVEAVAPAARETGQPWFFVRYWEGGAHLRVRARTSDAGALHDRLAAFAAGAGGRVEAVEYRPETARYGGPAGLARSEEFFHESSEVAAEVVARTPDAGARAGVALDLLTAFALAAAPSDADAVRLLRYYAAGLANVGEGPPVDVAAVARAAEAEYLDRGEVLRARFARQRERLPGLTRPASLADDWYLRVRALRESYAALDDAGELKADPRYVLLSQLHMFHNRLGVLLPEEAYLASLAAMLVAGAHALPDFRADGRDAADRTYHEQSKMYAARPWDIGWPVPDSAVPRWASGASGRVPLPAPDEARLAEPDLVRVLRARRSAYGRYDAPIDVSDLGTLLGYAAGTSRVTRLPAPDGVGPLIALRTYPSAGARYGVRVAVVARSVEGLPPAVYAYLPDEHALAAVAPAPSAGEVEQSSPMFRPADGQPAIDAAAAPALLCLVGELSYQREKYGIRAYRLLHLECGHLAQNLALVATAMGLATVPLGSFHDDATDRLVLADGAHESVLYVLPLARATPDTVTAPEAARGPTPPV